MNLKPGDSSNRLLKIFRWLSLARLELERLRFSDGHPGSAKMRARTTEPTPYSEVNSALQALHSAVSQTLGKQFAGLYLYGSLAGGFFNTQSSDIDFVVATQDALPEKLVRSLNEMHARLAASGNPWARRMEGDYIPLVALRRHDPLNPPHTLTWAWMDISGWNGTAARQSSSAGCCAGTVSPWQAMIYRHWLTR